MSEQNKALFSCFTVAVLVLKADWLTGSKLRLHLRFSFSPLIFVGLFIWLCFSFTFTYS